jgi:hypothetical protein
MTGANVDEIDQECQQYAKAKAEEVGHQHKNYAEEGNCK